MAIENQKQIRFRKLKLWLFFNFLVKLVAFLYWNEDKQTQNLSYGLANVEMSKIYQGNV